MIGLGREPVDYMRLPWNISMHHAHQGYRYFAGFLNPMVLMFVPLALVFWLREKRFLYLLAAGVITMALWSLGSQQVRFLLPAYSLLALCAGLGAAKLMEWSRRQRIFFVRPAVWAAVLILVTSAWWRSVEQWPQVLLSIFETPSVMEVSAPRMCPQVPAMRFVNKHLPAYDTRIMLVDFNGGFILNHQYIFDSFYEASQVREMIAECGSPAVLQTMLESKRFTHVMRWPQIRGEGVQRFFATKEDEERFGKAEQILAAYLSRYCERVAEVEGTEIYRIRTELPGRPLPEGLAERWMPGWGTTGRRNW